MKNIYMLPEGRLEKVACWLIIISMFFILPSVVVYGWWKQGVQLFSKEGVRKIAEMTISLIAFYILVFIHGRHWYNSISEGENTENTKR